MDDIWTDQFGEDAPNARLLEEWDGGAAIEVTVLPHLAVCIAVDVSSSMIAGDNIGAVNRGLREIKDVLMGNEDNALQTDIEIITFNHDAKIHSEWQSAYQFEPPTLSASGGTDIAKPVLLGLNTLRARRHKYLAAGTPFHKPFFILLSDGYEEGNDISAAAAELEKQVNAGNLRFFFGGVKGYKEQVAKDLTRAEKAIAFELDTPEALHQFLRWVGLSVGRVSESHPGDKVESPPVPAEVRVITLD